MMITDTSAISLAPLEDILSRIFFGMPRFLCEKKDEKKTAEKSERKLSANGTDLSTQEPKNTLDDVKKKDKKKDE